VIEFESLQVENFALYPFAEIRFSKEEQNPLTIIRGENESGKTTLMRAFVWSLFGEDALPHIPEVRHPLRPVWSKDGESIETTVKISFLVSSEKGSSRYRLSRRVTTTEQNRKVDYGEEQLRLLKFAGDEWLDQTDSLHLLQRKYFRPELRDFYFIDADKAVEFVGGPEGRHDDSMMRESTTQAVRSLLGLNVMNETADRLDRLQTEFNREVGRQSTNKEQQELAEELAETEQAFQQAKIDLKRNRKERKEAKEKLERVQAEFDADLEAVADLQEVNAEIDQLEEELQRAKDDQAQFTADLSNFVSDERLFVSLMAPAVESVAGELKPLKDEGLIPPSELSLIPRLIDAHECVCGTDLDQDSEARKTLEKKLATIEAQEESARFLAEALDYVLDARSRVVGIGGERWLEELHDTLDDFAEASQELQNIQVKLGDLKDRRDEESGNSSELQIKKNLVQDMQAKFDRLDREVEGLEETVETLKSEKRGLEEKIRVAGKAEERTREVRNAAEVANDLRTLVDEAYGEIEQEQVKDVSASMNAIFRDVISATEDALFQEVGIRQVDEDRYEPFAMDGKREKPLALANGASRRALAVAFVLALAEQTGTQVPFVADSLLHAMSGTVKTKIVDYITSGDKIGQPILFGTRTDLLDEEVKDLLKRRSDRTYTLTSQTHVGGDVVRAAKKATRTKQVVVCDCSVDQYCDVCERVGDKEREEDGRLSYRENSRILGY
jgi:DNA sulfur modification protein DndD